MCTKIKQVYGLSQLPKSKKMFLVNFLYVWMEGDEKRGKERRIEYD